MPRTWTSLRSRQLSWEPLEDRSLLAVAAFEINLYEDVGGSPGALITDDTVEVGETFFVEVTAREFDPLRGGLPVISLDISWNADVLDAIDAPQDGVFDASEIVTDDLPLFRDGVMNHDAGTIDNLRGAAFLSSDVGRAIGNLFPERFALLHFEAKASVSDTQIWMWEGGSGIGTVPVASLGIHDLDFEIQTITVVAPSELSNADPVTTADPAIIVEPVTTVAPVSAVNEPTSTSLPANTIPPAITVQPAPAAVEEVTSVTRANLVQENTGSVIGLELNLYEDAAGAPGDLLADDAVAAGESFFVEIAAEDLRDAPEGIGGLSVDVGWDPGVLQEIDSPFDPSSDTSQLVTASLPVFRSGTLDNNSGSITDLGGASLRSTGSGEAIGKNGPERFSLLHFRAIADGSSDLSLGIGDSGAGLVNGAVRGDEDVAIESQTIAVVDNLEPPQVEVTATSSGDLDSVRFGTQLGDGSTSPLVRPAFPDSKQFVEVRNTGPSTLTISRIEINAPDVSADVASGLVVGPGQTRRIGLSYAPRTPNPQDTSTQSFAVAGGLVIHSNAANRPRIEIALAGESTFDADVNYDGRVNLADIVQFDDQVGLRIGDVGYNQAADPNGDGALDLADFGVLNVHYGQAREAVQPSSAPQLAAMSVQPPAPKSLLPESVAKNSYAQATDAVFGMLGRNDHDPLDDIRLNVFDLADDDADELGGLFRRAA